jgi:hypothetical protein
MATVGGRVDSCCTRSPGQPGANNRPPDTATAVSASDTPGSTNRRPMAAASAPIATTASTNPPPAASRHHRIRIDRAQPHGEHRPHRLGTLGEAAQPAPHRLRRASQIRGDPAEPGPARGLRRQRRHDHRRGVGAAQQRGHRQQHMRHPAPGASRPTRAQLHRPVRAAQLPRPSPSPARQHAPAWRTGQLTGRQPALDLIDICFYGDHCASEREQTALP